VGSADETSVGVPGGYCRRCRYRRCYARDLYYVHYSWRLAPHDMSVD
jgi:hypothetical protein